MSVWIGIHIISLQYLLLLYPNENTIMSQGEIGIRMVQCGEVTLVSVDNK